MVTAADDARDVRGETLRILILAGDFDGNLGDRAILMATCDALREVQPEVELTVISSHPEASRLSFGATAVPRGLRYLGKRLRAASRSDRVLVGGGGLFQDDDSLVKMPYWAARVALNRLVGARLSAHGLGVGPLDAVSSRLAARLAFMFMDEITVRDERARDVARPLARKPVVVVPDPAVALRPATPSEALRALAETGVPLDGRPLLGVAPRRWFPSKPRIVPHKIRWRLGLTDVGEDAGSTRLIELLAASLLQIAQRRHAHVVLLPTYCNPEEGDDVISAGIRDRLPPGTSSLLRIQDPRLYKAVAGQLHAFLGGRMHPLILAAGMGTPTVGLAYNPKFFGFMQAIGRSNWVLDVATFVRDGGTADLSQLLDEALCSGRQPTAIMDGMAAQVTAHCRRLAAVSP